MGGEIDLEQFRQYPDQKIGNLETQFGRNEFALIPVDVLPALNGAQNRRIGGRPADAVFFQLLDQRRFGIARRRLGEFLLPGEIDRLAAFAFLQLAEQFDSGGIVAFSGIGI